MAPNTACLAKLPTELILEIKDRLALDAILALKLTQRRFNNIFPLDQTCWQDPRSRCAQRALQIYLASPLPEPSHRHCVLCNAEYPVSQFKSSNSPSCAPLEHINIPHDIVKLPSRVCSWHVRRFTRTVKSEAGGRDEWVSHGDSMCMHCGDIQGWKKCRCECDSCSLCEVTTYTRHVNNAEECRTPVFWRDALNSGVEGEGQLWVREKLWVANRKQVIDLPVRSESA
ncbi:hypothetical protein G6011_06527 [Alternaria panax]|uniref:F-box domain-containing protein n=1 Tax=Alternaria panax TaxID=48097 RepID=A0AAD4I9T4_9PLEO|nr:hypothetical protein G6011_06527 [Alternaria panax]